QKVQASTPKENTSKRQARPSRYISKSLRIEVRKRSQGQCEYVDPVTKRRCESRSDLQFDHKVPFARGGRTELSNLRHYCRGHNTLSAIQAYGKDKMSQYLKY